MLVERSLVLPRLKHHHLGAVGHAEIQVVVNHTLVALRSLHQLLVESNSVIAVFGRNIHHAVQTKGLVLLTLAREHLDGHIAGSLNLRHQAGEVRSSRMLVKRSLVGPGLKDDERIRMGGTLVKIVIDITGILTGSLHQLTGKRHHRVARLGSYFNEAIDTDYLMCSGKFGSRLRGFLGTGHTCQKH